MKNTVESNQPDVRACAPESVQAPLAGSRTTTAALLTAAITGLTLGACSKSGGEETGKTQAAVTAASAAASGKDKACCMGLNDCKGKGGCAVPESHSCAGKNECKGKGGCNMHCPKK